MMIVMKFELVSLQLVEKGGGGGGVIEWEMHDMCVWHLQWDTIKKIL